MFATEMTDEFRADLAQEESAVERSPGRWGQPEELAAPVAFSRLQVPPSRLAKCWWGWRVGHVVTAGMTGKEDT